MEQGAKTASTSSTACGKDLIGRIQSGTVQKVPEGAGRFPVDERIKERRVAHERHVALAASIKGRTTGNMLIFLLFSPTQPAQPCPDLMVKNP